MYFLLNLGAQGRNGMCDGTVLGSGVGDDGDCIGVMIVLQGVRKPVCPWCTEGLVPGESNGGIVLDPSRMHYQHKRCKAPKNRVSTNVALVVIGRSDAPANFIHHFKTRFRMAVTCLDCNGAVAPGVAHLHGNAHVGHQVGQCMTMTHNGVRLAQNSTPALAFA